MRSHKRCDPLKTARMWPWKSESSKECVTTHLPKRVALKMEAARVLDSYFAVETFCSQNDSYVSTCRRVVSVALKGMREWSCLEPPIVQILVVVANTQVRLLRANVEKGSMLTAIEHGSVGPKRMAKAISESKTVLHQCKTLIFIN